MTTRGDRAKTQAEMQANVRSSSAKSTPSNLNVSRTDTSSSDASSIKRTESLASTRQIQAKAALRDPQPTAPTTGSDSIGDIRAQILASVPILFQVEKGNLYREKKSHGTTVEDFDIIILRESHAQKGGIYQALDQALYQALLVHTEPAKQRMPAIAAEGDSRSDVHAAMYSLLDALSDEIMAARGVLVYDIPGGVRVDSGGSVNVTILRNGENYEARPRV